MKSVVFDCMVLLQAAVRTRGPSAECLRHLEASSAVLLVSPDTLFELRDVLTRREIRGQFPILTDEYVAAYLLKIQAYATELMAVAKFWSLPRDPKDEPYVNLAIAGAADFLVSRDLDLLALMQDTAFTAAHPELAVCDPVAFLDILRSGT
jgi:uncharacterized protein